MSETERAIIKQHEPDDIVLEETPAYTEHQLWETKSRYDEEVEGTKDLLGKKVREQVNVLDLMKSERRKTRVGDLLVSPFSRAFDSPDEPGFKPSRPNDQDPKQT